MNATTRYLDTRFPSLDALISGVDTESERLSALRSQHEAAVLAERKQAEKEAIEATSQRFEVIDAILSSDPLNSEPIQIPVELFDVPGLPKAIDRLVEARRLEALETVLSQVRDPSATREMALKYEPILQRSLLATNYTLDEDIRREIRESLKAIDAIKRPLVHSTAASLREKLEESKWPQSMPNEAAFAALSQAIEVDTDAAYGVLVEALDERVRFNFERYDASTARADKPEWLLAYFTKIVEPHVSWLLRRGMLMPFFKALLPSFARALSAYFVAASGDPISLRHIVSETLSFDADLRQRWFFDGPGLLARILTAPNLEVLVAGERRQALESLAVCVEEGDEIDFDVDAIAAKPTFAAENVRELFTAATDVLRSADPALDNAQLLLVREVHVPLLDSFHMTLQSWLKTDDGSTPNDELIALAKVYGSAAYVRQFLAAAGGDAHFVRLWHVLDSSEVAVEEGMFDAVASRFDEIHVLASKLLVKNLGRQFRLDLRGFARQDWSDPAVGVSSATLLLTQPLRLLERLCNTSKADRTRLFVPLAQNVAEFLWNNVVQANTWKVSAALFFEKEIRDLWTTLTLPVVPKYTQLLAAAEVLQGQSTKHLLEEEVNNLLRRRI